MKRTLLLIFIISGFLIAQKDTLKYSKTQLEAKIDSISLKMNKADSVWWNSKLNLKANITTTNALSTRITNDSLNLKTSYYTSAQSRSVIGDSVGVERSARIAADNLKANINSPTFTGTVILPSTTSIGTVSSAEIGYLDDVTSNIQTQLGAKLSVSDSNIYATQYDLVSGLATKQNTLLSGTNIKSINGSSILGSGNLTVTGGSAVDSVLLDELGFVRPEHWGAQRDTSFDSTPAFQAMYNSNDTLRVWLHPNAMYKVKAIDNIREYPGGYNLKVVEIYGNNATIYGDGTFFTLTSGEDASDGAWSGWGYNDNSGPGKQLRTAALADTLFNTDFIKGSLWVGIADLRDWTFVNRHDMLIVGADEGFNEHNPGACMVIDYVDYVNGRLYFTKPLYYGFDDANIFDLRYVTCGGKTFKADNLNFINSEFRVTGFETVQINSVSTYLDSTYQDWFEQAEDETGGDNAFITQFTNEDVFLRAGMRIGYNKTVWMDNCLADNFIIPGTGYGLVPLQFDEFYINNYRAKNCRHAFSTSSPFSSTTGATASNLIVVTNSSFEVGQNTYDDIPANISGYDTHQGIYEIIIDNCTMHGGDMFAQLRSHKIRISNCTTFDVLMMAQVGGGEGEKYGREVYITGNQSYGIMRYVYPYTSGGGGIAKMIISDNYADFNKPSRGGGNRVGFVDLYDDLNEIDTLIVQNNILMGSDDGSDETMFYVTAANNMYGTVTKVQHLVVKNNVINDWSRIINVDTCQIPYLTFTGNIITNVNALVVAMANDSGAANVYKQWFFKDNYFKNLGRIFYNEGAYNRRYDNFTFDNNIFDSLGIGTTTAPFGQANDIYNNFMFRNNWWKNWDSGSLMRFYRRGNSNFEGDRFDFAAGSGALVYDGTASGLEKHKLNFINCSFNMVSTSASGTKILGSFGSGGIDATFVRCYFNIDEVACSDVIQPPASTSSKLRVINSVFDVKDASNINVITVESGTTATISGNTFTMKNATGINAVDGNTGYTIYWGENFSTGTSVPVDTTGGTAYKFTKFGN